MAFTSFSRDENVEQHQIAVSPAGEILNTSSFAIRIHVVAHLDKPVDISYAKKAIHEILLARSPRFSCIPIKNENGVLQWEKREVNVDDHVFVPHFPPHHTFYDKLIEEYVSDMHLRPLPPCRPLWDFHFLNYKTTNGEATVIMNLHHMLGDGVSLMSLFLACSTNPRIPTLPPTLISRSHHRKHTAQIHERSHWGCSGFNLIQRIWISLLSLFLVIWYTLHDLITSFLRVKWLKDSNFPIRGPPGVELLPKVMASTTFSLDDVRKIKEHVGGTVNDVILGVIFYGFQKYCQNVLPDPKQMEKLRVTAIALVNTRPRSGLKNAEGRSGPSGNHFGYLHLQVPTDKLENPQEYIRRAKHMTDTKKMSMAVFITSRVLTFITGFISPETSAKALYNTLANTTLTITNLEGPIEEIAVAGYTVKNFFFSVSGAPQTIMVTCVSYMENLRVQVIATKGYVDAEHLSMCFEQAFKEFKEVCNVA